MSNPKKTSKRGSAAKKTTKTASKRGATSPSHNLRSAEGRVEFDNAVLSAVAKSPDPVAMGDILNTVGGSPPQIRSSLGRLIDAGQVTSTGKTRNMRYSIPGAGRSAA